jgi:hypothetical protein
MFHNVVNAILSIKTSRLRYKQLWRACDDGDGGRVVKVVQGFRDGLVEVQVESVQLIRTIQGQGSNPVCIVTDQLRKKLKYHIFS